MRIFGCDFSGAKDASKKICVCRADWQDERLVLQDVVELEERLDLLYLMQSEAGVWGLDMPFSLPRAEVGRFGGWRSALRLANQLDRTSFRALFPKKHSKLSDESLFRTTDLAVSAKSPISVTPLDMLAMTFGAFKVLDTALLNPRVAVYPLMDIGARHDVLLSEVYPRCLLDLLKMKHEELQMQSLLARFAERVDSQFRIEFDEHVPAQIKSEHAWDAVLASITLAYCMWRHRFHETPDERPSFLSDKEWALRKVEGAVIRILV